MRLIKLLACSAVLFFCELSISVAEDIEPSIFSINGFGTLGVLHSDEDHADYVIGPTQPNGPGHARDWGTGTDTRLGLQLTANISSKFTAVVQVVSELRHDNSYTPFVEWANIKYDLTPDLSIRAGRIVLPVFLSSDYRKVGYANPWVRPPVEFYNLVPVTNNDGVDVNYQFQLGSVSNRLQVFYGRKNNRGPDGLKVESRDAFGIANTVEFGSFILRGAYHQTHLTIDAVGEFFDLFRQFGPQGIAIADRYDIDSKKIEVITVGGSYDPGNWFVMGEWGSSFNDFFGGDQVAWYVTGGYRINKFTPYLTYSQRRKLTNATDPGLNVAALPPFLAGFAGGLNAGLNSFLAANEMDTVSIGARWDFMDNVDLKLQFDHISLDDNSQGFLTNVQPGFRPGGSLNIFSVTIDFVF